MWPKSLLFYLLVLIAWLFLWLFLWQQPLSTKVQAAENGLRQLHKPQSAEDPGEAKGEARSEVRGQATLQILIPFYNYPAWYDASAYIWDDLAASNDNVTITAIINPNDGPNGGPPNEDYTVGLSTLRDANIPMVGYVQTDFGARPLAQVKADIDLYNLHYNINGIFLDEASNQSSDLAYYEELYNYIKSLPNQDTVILNPGTNTAEAYLNQPASDIVMVLDDTASAWSAFTPNAYMAAYPADRFAIAIYNVPSVTALQAAIDLAKERNVGYVYFTDDIAPNPWDTLPTFWQAELDYLQRSNQVPTATPTDLPSCLLFTGPLNGKQEVPPVVTATEGQFTLLYDQHNQTSYTLWITPTQTITVTGLHIHVGQQGTNGPIIRNLANFSLPAVMTTTFSVAATVAPAFNLTETNQLRTGALYINLHTTDRPAGAIRGQINSPGTPCLTPTTTPTVAPTVTPAPTASATPTPTNPNLPTATATATATGPALLYLPAIAQRPATPTVTLTPIPTPIWQQLAGSGLNVAALAIQGDTLFVGTSGASGKERGLYRGSLTACHTGITLNKVSDINKPDGESIFGITFAGSAGVVASYDAGIYRSDDSGSHWLLATTPLIRPRSVANVNSTFFAGTEDQGVYQSQDNGNTWLLLSSNPKAIMVVRLDQQAPNILWIGSAGEGAYLLNTDISRLTQNKNGLSGAALNVWDFSFTSTQIYLATEGGAFVGDGSNAWTPFGTLPGVQLRSLQLVDAALYAGANNNGVWRRALTASAWERVIAPGWDESATVRDLLYDGAYCQGLLAATNNGVWVYRDGVHQ